MHVYAVVGHPVAHSRSPFIHTRFARQTGQALRYGRLAVPVDGFEPGVRDFAAGRVAASMDDEARAPGADAAPAQAGGCNVTVPFKFEALTLATDATERATLAGAANVLRFDADGWSADNTDGVGLVRDLTRNAQAPIAGRRVLMVGAGGAAAGALGPLLAEGPAELVLANRSADKAQALVERHAAWAQRHGARLEARALDDIGVEGYDFVLNATAISLSGASWPLPARALAPGALALDMMYGPAARPFLAWAQAQGARARDGLGMLVEQAAEAFAFWRGLLPDTAEVLRELRAVVDAEAPAAPAAGPTR